MAIKRYPVSGVATTAVESSGPHNLLGAAITAGRTFWLRKAWCYNSIGSQPYVMISDIAAGSTGPTGIVFDAADNVRAILHLVSGATGAMGHLQNAFEIIFDPPGLKFTTACVVSCDLTTSGVTCAGGLGYEE